MNVLLSYPKSGKTWTETRLILFLNTFTSHKPQTMGDLNQFLIRDHLGYDQHSTRMPDKFDIHGFDNHPILFILLRDAKKVMNSIWQRDSTVVQSNSGLAQLAPFPADEFGDPIPAADFPKDFETFLKGKYGLERYVRFLNTVNEVVQARKKETKFIYSEDMFKEESIDLIPELLSFNLKLTKDQRSKIFTDTSIAVVKSDKRPKYLDKFASHMIDRRHIRKGKLEGYKELFTDELADWTSKYITKNCKLSEYLERYYL